MPSGRLQSQQVRRKDQDSADEACCFLGGEGMDEELALVLHQDFRRLCQNLMGIT